jgi:hypothetical protein
MIKVTDRAKETKMFPCSTVRKDCRKCNCFIKKGGNAFFKLHFFSFQTGKKSFMQMLIPVQAGIAAASSQFHPDPQ